MTNKDELGAAAGVSPTPDAPAATCDDKVYFTVEKANDALVYIKPIIDDIGNVYKEVLRLRANTQNKEETSTPDEDKEYETIMDRLSDLVDELSSTGVELKDFERGLVDFPAHHPADDREIHLCWEKSDPNVAYWHDVDAGMKDRHPISDLEPKPLTQEQIRKALENNGHKRQ